jgi:uncharacterized membrane protein
LRESGQAWQSHKSVARPRSFVTLRSQMSTVVQSGVQSFAPSAAAKRSRIESIDIVRGVVMILMALDHTRDFFGSSGPNPTNPATTTIPLFFTRWVTHFCAPTFFLLTGVGAFLAGRRKSKSELSGFLFRRGLWLIFLELVVSRVLGWQFNFDYKLTMLVVIWALGWAMIVLSGLVYLPASVVTAFGVVMIACHNLFDSVKWDNPLWSILHSPGLVHASPQHTIFVAYPLIPWIGVTAAGYGLGQVYSWPPERRRTLLLRLGLVCVALFVVLRAINIYGDPNRWRVQRSAAFTVLSFLNTTKYPPSLLYLLMTLGPCLLFLRALDVKVPGWLRPALIFGKVPMFYYLLHIPLIHLLAIAFCYARYGHVYWMFRSPDLSSFPFTAPPGWGYSLPVVYTMWIVVVVSLYPVCRWFAGVRQRRNDAWLSYF